MLFRSLMGDRWRVRDEHHGPMLDVVQRLLGLAYNVGPSRVVVTATLGEDYGLAGTDRQAVYDLAADWAAAAAFGNVNATGVSGSLVPSVVTP